MSKVEKSYYLLMFMVELAVSFLMGTYVVYLMDRGMSVFDCHLINMSMFVALLVFEVPTGVIADLFGRKISFIVSCFIRGIGLMIYAWADCLWLFVLGEVIYAFGATFSTGAFQSWMVDAVGHEKMQKIIPNGIMIAKVAGMLGATIGGYIMDYSLYLPWLIAGGMYWLAGIFAWWLMDEAITNQDWKRKNTIGDFLKYSHQGWRFIVEDKNFRLVVFTGFIQAIALHIVNLQWQILLEGFVIKKFYLGLVFSGISISLLLGTQWSKVFLTRLSLKPRLMIIQLLIAVGIILSVSTKISWLVLVFFFGHELFRGMFNSLFQSYLHLCIPVDKNNIRATLQSYQQMGDNVGRIIGLLIGGKIVSVMGIYYSWWLAGLVLIVSGGLFLLNGHLKWNKNRKG